MGEYLTTIVNQLGIPIWLFIIILSWTIFWKLLGLWKSARKGSVIWFIIIALFNTIGILPILYIYVFSKMKCFNIKKNKGTSKKKTPKKKKK